VIARLLISPSVKTVIEEIENILDSAQISHNHPDLLYFKAGEKLGIAQARKIKGHFSLKPYSAKGRVVVLEDASTLTIEAQNSLLKILEEPPREAIILLGAPSEANFLPTILSRVSIQHTSSSLSLRAEGPGVIQVHTVHNIEKLLNSNIEERFEYIEKLKEREEFLLSLVIFFREHLPANKDFVKELLLAEQWAKQNVNIRAILEYLMLVMPGSDMLK